MSQERLRHKSFRPTRAVTGHLDRSKVAHRRDRDKEETHG